MTWLRSIYTNTSALLVIGGIALSVSTAWIMAAFFAENESMPPSVAELAEFGRVQPIDDASIGEVERGRAYYAQVCVPCHGVRGDGAGEWAYRITPKPADLTGPRIASRSDAELFRTITDGIPGTAMIGWRRQLSDAQRRQLVAYVRHLAQVRGSGHE